MPDEALHTTRIHGPRYVAKVVPSRVRIDLNCCGHRERRKIKTAGHHARSSCSRVAGSLYRIDHALAVASFGIAEHPDWSVERLLEARFADCDFTAQLLARELGQRVMG